MKNWFTVRSWNLIFYCLIIYCLILLFFISIFSVFIVFFQFLHPPDPSFSPLQLWRMCVVPDGFLPGVDEPPCGAAGSGSLWPAAFRFGRATGSVKAWPWCGSSPVLPVSCAPACCWSPLRYTLRDAGSHSYILNSKCADFKLENRSNFVLILHTPHWAVVQLSFSFIWI